MAKFETNIEDAIGTSGAYFMFSGVCVVATVFVLLVVPETRGKSADDMREYFEGKWHDYGIKTVTVTSAKNIVED